MVSVADFRANLRSLAQMDIGPLQPKAKFTLDQMEYSTNGSASGQYTGTGVTITTQAVSGSLVQEGSFSLKAVTDGTANRSFGRTLSVNLSAYSKIKVWERSSATSDTIQFYLQDGSGNQSRWDITTNASAGTWQQDTLTLASPSSTSGTPANLASITSYGFRDLTASTTYYFDTAAASVGMTIAVRGTNLGSYYRGVSFGGQPLSVNLQAAPTVSAPAANPRIDILTINSSGTLAWVAGTESGSPVAPWSSVPRNVIPIAEVYMKTTMTQILDYEDKDTDANQGYILADVRPFITLAQDPKKGADVASASTMTLGNDGNVFDITGTTTINTISAKPAGECVFLQFDSALTVTDGSNLKLKGNFLTATESALILCSDGANWIEHSRSPVASAITSLTGFPSSFSSQAYKWLRVNSGATAVEFIPPSSAVESSIEENTSSHKIRLVGDTASPGNNKRYGTNSSGTRGWISATGIPLNCQQFTSSGTWTRPTGVDNVYTKVWGAGGGGQGAGSIGGAHPPGFGGSGGGKCEGIIAVTSNVTVTVGTGGAGGAAIGSTTGGTGGTSSFAGTTTCQATGGSGGGASPAGGTGSGGFLNLTGQAAVGNINGAWAADPLLDFAVGGADGEPQTGGTEGEGGPGYGAGGGGGAGKSSAGGADGGAGANGAVIVCY